MLFLKKIYLSNWRNISCAELEFGPKFNCICGDNGQGKTNLLDAVYCLSMTKSALGVSDACCVKTGSDSFSLTGTYSMDDGLTSVFSITSGVSGKVIRKDGKVCPSASSHIGRLPVVIVSPMDFSLISDGGEERRRFVNSVLSQLDNAYLASLQKYNRLLAQRNRMLKEQDVDSSLLDVIDSQMSVEADMVCSKRLDFVRKLEPLASSHYSQISGGRESISIKYDSELLDGWADGHSRPLEELLLSSRSRDKALRFTSVGIQRDDFLFCMNGVPIRKYGSQGQQKSFLVAMKLSQYDIMKQVYGYPPILILDDVFDRLDENRMSNLLKLVGESEGGQIFISDTDCDRLKRILDGIDSDAGYYVAENGSF